MSCDEGQLQAYLDDALSDEEREQVERQLEECESCKETLRLLTTLQDELASQFSPLVYAIDETPVPTERDAWAQFERQLSSTREEHTHATSPISPSWIRQTISWFQGGGLAIGMAAAILLIAMGTFDPFGFFVTGTTPKDTWKGTHELQLFHTCRSPEGHLHRCPTENGTALPPGTFIQFTYKVNTQPTPRHVMIVSINEKGTISPYIPLDRKHSIPLRKAIGTLPASASLELDDYLGREMIIAILSKTPFTYANAKRMVAKAFRRQSRTLKGFAIRHKAWYIHTWLIQKRRPEKP